MLAQYLGSSPLPRGPLTVIASTAPLRAIALGPTAALTAISRADLPNRVIRPNLATSDDPPAGNQLFPFSYFAGTGTAGFSGDGGLATSAQLDMTVGSVAKRSGLAMAIDGTLYIADTNNSTVRVVAGQASSEPGVIRSFIGKWAASQNVSLVEPLGIAVDRAGNLYIADHTAQTVSVLTKATGRLAILAHVASPATVAVANDGSKVFVASPEARGVFRITTLNGSLDAVPGLAPTTGADSESAGSCGGLDNPAPTSPALAAPRAVAPSALPICPAGLAVDGRQNLFVADAIGGRILRVDAATGQTSTVVVGLIAPGDIAFDADGDLFVSEQGRNRIIAMGQVGDPASSLILSAPAPPAGCPQGAAFTYCNEPTSGKSPSFAFTLSNTSAGTINNIVITPAFVPAGTQPPPPSTNFTTTSTSCTGMLTPNSSCVINVAFTPLAPGAIAGQLIASDSNPSDTQTINLAGTGDDFSLAIANGQSEVSVSQGDTATFLAELDSDSVFGLNGEKVTLSCPATLPAFTTCEFKPCPVVPTVGGATSFSILIHTSTATDETPPIPNPCNSATGAVRLRAGMPAGIGDSRALPPAGYRQFPALLTILMFGTLGLAAIRASSSHSRRAFAAITLLALASGLVAACHKKGVVSTTATPIGTTVMSVTANAVDSNGNSLNASRGLKITLDVVKQAQQGPRP